MILFIFEKEGKEGRKEKRKCERNMDWLPLAGPQLGTWPPTQTPVVPVTHPDRGSNQHPFR